MPLLPPSRKPTARNRPVIAAIRIPVRNRFIVLRSAVSREKDRPLALHEMGGDRPGFKPWRGPATVPYKGNAPQVHHPDTAAARLRRDAFERRQYAKGATDRKSTRLNSSHKCTASMPSSD